MKHYFNYLYFIFYKNKDLIIPWISKNLDILSIEKWITKRNLLDAQSMEVGLNLNCPLIKAFMCTNQPTQYANTCTKFYSFLMNQKHLAQECWIMSSLAWCKVTSTTQNSMHSWANVFVFFLTFVEEKCNPTTRSQWPCWEDKGTCSAPFNTTTQRKFVPINTLVGRHQKVGGQNPSRFTKCGKLNV